MRALATRLLPQTLQRGIRRWLIHRRRGKFVRYQVRRRYGDASILIEPVDAKGKSWYDYDRDFEPELKLLREAGLVPGARVFDLGAHQGVVALALAHIVGQQGQVVAVEANPFDVSAARRNQQLNKARQLEVVHAAVAAKRGGLEFMESGRVVTGDASQPSVAVRAVTVDELAEEFGQPDVLFIDVDGYEMEALRGAEKVLQHAPCCYVEVHSELLPQYGHKAQDILGFFAEDRYRLLVSHEMRPSKRRFVEFDRASHDFSLGFHLVALPRTT